MIFAAFWPLFDSIPDGEQQFSGAGLARPETRLEIAYFSPFFRLVENLLARNVSLTDISPRQFEKLLADLLDADGYSVTLGKGAKDGGVDVWAERELPGIGLYAVAWQAKHPLPKNRVRIGVVRELAGVRAEREASKGMIATTTYLTKDALEMVKRHKYTLGKVDKDDLMEWMARISRG
ncbi:MAG: restriction endonuclease [Chloroflexota bacterium]